MIKGSNMVYKLISLMKESHMLNLCGSINIPSFLYKITNSFLCREPLVPFCIKTAFFCRLGLSINTQMILVKWFTVFFFAKIFWKSLQTALKNIVFTWKYQHVLIHFQKQKIVSNMLLDNRK